MRSTKSIAIPLLLGALITVAIACTATPASPRSFEPRDITTSPTPDATATPRPNNSEGEAPGVPPSTGETEPTSTPVLKPTQKPTPPPEPPSTGGSDAKVPTSAPIDGVEVGIAESFPPQYFLTVHSGLPSGCVRFGRYEVAREGDVILVRVTNLQPADREIMCTQLYGNVETRISLGSDFEPGRTYTVKVNDFTTTFVTPGAAGTPLDISYIPQHPLGRPFQLTIHQPVFVISPGIILEVGFAKLVEDSRCPANVNCIWAGQAKILVEVRDVSYGESWDRYELTLGDGPVDFDGYSIEFLALDPYPPTPEAGADSEESVHVATLALDTPASRSALESSAPGK